MTRKNHLCLGSLCIGMALCLSTPAAAGWGSSFGSGGSSGASHGSYGSTGRVQGHFSHGSSGGSHGSFGSHGSRGSWASWGGGSSGGSSGGWGSSGGSSGGSGLFHGGLINRLRSHHHRSWFASHGSSGGSWGGSRGSHGSSGGSWGGSRGSYGSHGSHGSSGGSVGGSVHSHLGEEVDDDAMDGTVIEGEEVTDEAEAPIPTSPLENSAHTQSNLGSLVVTVPANAKLTINGQKTVSSGTTRHFVSRGLKQGLRYSYSVKATAEVNGQEVVRTQQTSLRAGEENRLSFDFDRSTETKLTVFVPANAQLELAGTSTKSTGAMRKFTTTKLAPGQIWSDYRVVVSLQRNGQTVTREQTIEMRGGEDRTLSFDFDAPQVAAR